MPRIRLRILSDLHFAEPASRIVDLSMVRPLFDGPEAFILNGDSIDTRFLEREPTMAAGREAFLAFIAPFGDRLTLITGNHDPNISAVHHLELANGRILITHGDVLFPSVAPWGWEAPHVIAARERRLAEIDPVQHGRLETQLEVCKHSSYATRHLSPTALAGTTSVRARLLHLLSRVRRADKILTSWVHAPSLAARLAERHRPGAELVIIGHTHLPGLWRRSSRWVINTGAFTPPLGARVVDFIEDRVEVRRVVARAGEFRIGGIAATLRPGRELTTPFF